MTNNTKKAAWQVPALLSLNPWRHTWYKDPIREVSFQGYRIKNEQTVQIVTVLHGARDLANMQPPWQPPNNEP